MLNCRCTEDRAHTLYIILEITLLTSDFYVVPHLEVQVKCDVYQACVQQHWCEEAVYMVLVDDKRSIFGLK
jgi:hypothetical protein